MMLKLEVSICSPSACAAKHCGAYKAGREQRLCQREKSHSGTITPDLLRNMPD